MRMKEDHMRNGQLKPGYNVQIGTVCLGNEEQPGIPSFTASRLAEGEPRSRMAFACP